MNSIMLNRVVQWLRRPRVRTGIGAAIAVAAIVASACSVHTISDTDSLTTIVVTPTATLAATSRRQMRALGLDANGRIVNIVPRWSVAGSGGTITSDGIFTASEINAALDDTVIATARGISGRALIKVTP
jgi:hypothetical protein